MKRILVHLRESGQVVVSDPMSDDDAATEMARIEREVATAGTANTIIRLANNASFQSKDFLYLQVVDYVSAGSHFGDDDEPFFTRGMKF